MASAHEGYATEAPDEQEDVVYTGYEDHEYLDDKVKRISIEKRGELLDWLSGQPSEISFADLQLGAALGKGSFGQVFLANYHGKQVAVKKLYWDDSSDVEFVRVLENFRREITTLRNCHHTNIVQFYGACTDRNNLAIVTEFMPGGSLDDALHKRHVQFDWESKRRIAHDIATGMNYLHTSRPQIIHRDLSSSNVLLDETCSTAKIADFGLSRLKETAGTIVATRLGRWRYAAPEITRNEDQLIQYSEKVDVYSFAIVLWELSSGTLPFGENVNDLNAAAMAAMQDARPSPFPADCPSPMVSLITACWDRDPRERPSFPEIIQNLLAM